MNETWINISKREGYYQDRQAAVASDESGTLCCVWSSFEGEYEVIYYRIIKSGLPDDTKLLFKTENACSSPRVITRSSGSFVAVWSIKTNDCTYIYKAVIKNNYHEKPVLISMGIFDADPDITIDQTGKLLVVYSHLNDDKRRIVYRVIDNNKVSEPVIVSGEDVECMRPRIISVKGDLIYVVWDSYQSDTGYTVCGCFVKNNEIINRTDFGVSPGRRIKPVAVADYQGRIYVAWLTTFDIINDYNVVDQKNIIEVVMIDQSGSIYNLCDDKTGAIADLSWGLTPKDQVWGYLGRRRYPILKILITGELCLMWERKSLWNGGTLVTSGTLCGRIWDGLKWSYEMCFHEGKRLYEIDSAMHIDKNQCTVIARENHCVSHIDFVVGNIKLLTGPLRTEPIEKWRTFIPKKINRTKRKTIMDCGVEYTLYWGDLHVHSVLSADAEGEIDEIIKYAEDIAGLDFCAIQDNDDCYLALTEDERITGQAFSKRYTKNGQIVFIPGFEWTCVESDGTRNHRSVLFRDYDKAIIRYTHQTDDVMVKLDHYANENCALLHPHHAEWTLHDHLNEVANAEVCSGWAQYIMDSTNIYNHLKKGRIFGFIGGSDNHRRNPGYGGSLTGIYARDLTLEALIEALQNRRCFATDGNLCIIEFSINNTFMGGIVQAEKAIDIHISIDSPHTIKQVVLYKNGEPLRVFQVSSNFFITDVNDNSETKGKHFYTVFVETDTPWKKYKSNIAPAFGPHAWSSPIWVSIN